MNKFFFVIAVLAIACNNAGNQPSAERPNGYAPTLVTKEDSLFHDVMSGHDTGMARMGKLIGYKKQARLALDSIKNLPAKNKDTAYMNVLDSLSGTLHKAESGMNRWMEEFKLDSAANDQELRIRYLQDEKKKVTTIAAQIKQALQQADSVLKKRAR